MWGDDDNLFSSDVSNVFLSRRAYLHADANATLGATATATVPIAATDRYHVLARYEAGYRFSSPFKVTVAQNGATQFEKTFGLKTTPKIWQLQGSRAGQGNFTGTYGCGAGLVGECRWPWSSTENQVWEGVHDAVNLTVGAATITLTIVGVDGSVLPESHAGSTGDRWGMETALGELITERNIDAIMLFPNASDLTLRTTNDLTGGSDGLVLDSLVGTQESEVFVQLISQSTLPLTVGFPRSFNRSPLWFGRGTFFPLWGNSSNNINIANQKTGLLPTPPADGKGRVDSAGWIWNIHDGCDLADGGDETGTVVVGANITDSAPSLGSGWGSECVSASVLPGQTSEWIDVGRMIDTLDHSSWNLPAGNYSVRFGVRDDGAAGAGRKIVPVPGGAYSAQPMPGAAKVSYKPTYKTLLLDANIRATRRVRPIEADFYEMFTKLKAEPLPHGRVPTEVMLTGGTFSGDWAKSMYTEGRGVSDPEWVAKTTEFQKMVGLTLVPPSRNSTTAFGGTGFSGPADLQALVDAGANNLSMYANLGDEIGLSRPESHYPPATNQTLLNRMMEVWLKERGVTPAEAGCDPYIGCIYNKSILLVKTNAKSFYWSNRFSDAYGLVNGTMLGCTAKKFPLGQCTTFMNRTKTLQAFQKKTGQLQKLHTCANFPPSRGQQDLRYNMSRLISYLPLTNMWVNAYRVQPGQTSPTFTLPFTEE